MRFLPASSEGSDALPDGDEELIAAITDAEPPERRHRWVAANMVSSLDGAIDVDHRSAPLSSPSDRAVFHALRSRADVIVVGAGTARAEGYRRPAAPTGLAAEARHRRNQEPVPRLCVVSGSLSFDTLPPALSEPPPPDEHPVWLATTRTGDEVDSVAPLADRIEVKGAHVAASPLVDALSDRGMRHILVEGGPTLLGSFVTDDTIDEWNVTIAPVAVSGSGRRMTAGPPTSPRSFVVDQVIEHESNLFVRYLRSR